MPGAFEDIHLGWGGVQYTIPSNRVMGAIARVEDVMTLSELYQHGQRETVPLGKIAMAYGALLRYAGAPVSDEDVYAGMFSQGADHLQEQVRSAIEHLCQIMLPPSARAEVPQENPPQQAAAEDSPNPPSKPRLAVGG